MPAATKSKPDVVELILKCARARERGKKLYKRSDDLLAELLKQVDPGQPIKMNDEGRTAVIVDKWKDKTQVVAISFARRYELEIEDR